ncbi:hypothetical protein [Paraburkholderia hospita]
MNETEEQSAQQTPSEATQGQCFKTGQACGHMPSTGTDQNDNHEVTDVSN